MTWSSDFFALTGYSVLNLQKEYSQGNQIKTYLFEQLRQKKPQYQAEKRPNVKT